MKRLHQRVPSRQTSHTLSTHLGAFPYSVQAAHREAEDIVTKETREAIQADTIMAQMLVEGQL